MEQTLYEKLCAAVRDADLPASHIPDIDLYLDQILSIVSDHLRAGDPRYADRVLTKTMVNNYSKDGLIQPIRGKKYTKEQIIQMLLIYSLKNTLSMTEIKRMLTAAYDRKLSLTDGYEKYLSHKQEDRESSVQTVVDLIGSRGYDMTCEEDYLAAILEICTLSDYFRTLAQVLLESRYPDPDEASRKEKEAAREKIRQEKDAEKARQRREREEERLRKEQERLAHRPTKPPLSAGTDTDSAGASAGEAPDSAFAQGREAAPLSAEAVTDTSGEGATGENSFPTKETPAEPDGLVAGSSAATKEPS